MQRNNALPSNAARVGAANADFHRLVCVSLTPINAHTRRAPRAAGAPPSRSSRAPPACALHRCAAPAPRERRPRPRARPECRARAKRAQRARRAPPNAAVRRARHAPLARAPPIRQASTLARPPRTCGLTSTRWCEHTGAARARHPPTRARVFADPPGRWCAPVSLPPTPLFPCVAQASAGRPKPLRCGCSNCPSRRPARAAGRTLRISLRISLSRSLSRDARASCAHEFFASGRWLMRLSA